MCENDMAKKSERMRTKETYLSHTTIIIMMMYVVEYEPFFFTLVNETKIDKNHHLI
jgi:hypothetical protein